MLEGSFQSFSDIVKEVQQHFSHQNLMSQSFHDIDDIQSLQQFSEMVRDSEVSFDEQNNEGVNEKSLVKASIVSKSPQTIMQQPRPQTSQPVKNLSSKKKDVKKTSLNPSSGGGVNYQDIDVEFSLPQFEKDSSLAGTQLAGSKNFRVLEMDKSLKSNG